MDCQQSAEMFETFSPLDNRSLVPAVVPASRRNPCYWKLGSAIMGHASPLS